MTREERAYHYASKKNPSKFTVGEIAKHYDDGYVDGQKDVIDKACEWLEENVNDWIDMPYDQEAFIDVFKKAMEK